MQPHHTFVYGGVQSPGGNGHFQGPPFGFKQRGRMPPSQSQMYHSPGSSGQLPLMSGSSPHHHQQCHNGNGRMNGALPTLHGTHMLPVNRVPISIGSSGNVGPMPMPPIPPSSPTGSFMRRPPGSMRPKSMGYPPNYPRGMGVGNAGAGVGGHMLLNGAVAHGPSNQMVIERQGNGMLLGNHADIHIRRHQQAAVGAGGGRPSMAGNLPLLRGTAGFPSKYAMASHMVQRSYANGTMPYGAAGMEGSNNSNSNNSCSGSNDAGSCYAPFSSNSNSGGSNDFNDGEIFTVKIDEEELERKMREAPLDEGQNHCNVNTPPLVASDYESGLTPTPPVLRYLSSYEEHEVKGYIPNVYFGGTDQCKKINAVRGSDNNDGFDDENFHYRVVVGDHLLYRYEVLKVLGQGTFGIVVRAMDHKLHELVAIKIIKNKPNYTKQAQEEVKTLQLLNSEDPDDEANIVQLLDSCVFRNHYLLVFELLPSDLYALIQANKFRPMSRGFIYELAEQLLTALVHIRRHNVVHCDLKPENIMISEGKGSPSEPADFSLKLIDFGSACEESRPLFTYIQSRYYRAPEIVLGIPYTMAIDMWSFGCVLCELANGYPIFPASSEGELLERITEYFGPIPPYLIRQGRRSERFFEGDKMKFNLGKKRPPHPPSSRSLHNFLKVGQGDEDGFFEDFVSCCLELDSKKRLTPEAALEHPWIEYWRSCSTGSDPSDVSASSILGG
ncbi:Protein kinase-like protein [Leptomonas seymouri]|uniref:Protein kinase-like protein n=1 Tax=Leptomonas seymouri TaxID=5684 RepID=A0A0N0P4D6_LEPSE|nr:Protein kinase-like protein [Leptomonas seymouri]|eukprot:KPI85169.1 Protein kinase-like protein [Leptomonas seymouri]